MVNLLLSACFPWFFRTRVVPGTTAATLSGGDIRPLAAPYAPAHRVFQQPRRKIDAFPVAGGYLPGATAASTFDSATRMLE
jgi:hypothetical protein